MFFLFTTYAATLQKNGMFYSCMLVTLNATHTTHLPIFLSLLPPLISYSGAPKQTERRRRSSFGGSTVQYHSLADSLGEKGKLPWKQGRARKQQSVDVPVLPMNVLDSSHLPEAVMS